LLRCDRIEPDLRNEEKGRRRGEEGKGGEGRKRGRWSWGEEKGMVVKMRRVGEEGENKERRTRCSEGEERRRGW
jgi:hypothetical protein